MVVKVLSWLLGAVLPWDLLLYEMINPLAVSVMLSFVA